MISRTAKVMPILSYVLSIGFGSFCADSFDVSEAPVL